MLHLNLYNGTKFNEATMKSSYQHQEPHKASMSAGLYIYLIYDMLKLLRLSWEDISFSPPYMKDFALVPPSIYWPHGLFCDLAHLSLLTPFGHMWWSKREITPSLLSVIICIKFLDIYWGRRKCREALYISLVSIFSWMIRLKHLGSKISIYYGGTQWDWNDKQQAWKGLSRGRYLCPPKGVLHQFFWNFWCCIV